MLAVSALGACTDDGPSSSGGQPPNDTEARRVFTSADGSIDEATRKIGRLAAAPAAGTVDISTECYIEGTVALSGSFDAGPAGTSFNLDASFDGCVDSRGALDGELHWTSTVTAGRVEDAWTGSLSFRDEGVTWQCTFDVRAVVDATGVRYSGSVCGYDVEVWND